MSVNKEVNKEIHQSVLGCGEHQQRRCSGLTKGQWVDEGPSPKLWGPSEGFFHKKMVLGPLDLFRPFLTCLDLFHGFIAFIQWFMIDLPDLWLISPPRGVGFEPATLWLRAAACKTTGLYPSSPPSGTQNTLWYKNKIQHLQNSPNTFRIYPTPSEFTQHLHNSLNTFRIHPPPSDNKSVLRPLDLFGPFLTFFPKIPRSQQRRFWQKWFCWKKIMKT